MAEARDSGLPGNAGVPLVTGGLTPEQIDLLLLHLPVDVTLIDDTDTVRYFTGRPDRIFPRPPGIIGRKVQNCHPEQSLSAVEAILSAFRSGERSQAEFWIETQGKFVHIRYFALRDAAGTYRGCIEVTQDVTGIRRLEGEKRLLDWA